MAFASSASFFERSRASAASAFCSCSRAFSIARASDFDGPGAGTTLDGSIGIVAGVGDGEAAGDPGDEYGELGDGEYGEIGDGPGDAERGAVGAGEYGELGDGALPGRSGGGTGAGIEDSGRDVGLIGCCPTARDGTGDWLEPDACGAGAGALLSPPCGF
jgi:hypothetical protein